MFLFGCVANMLRTLQYNFCTEYILLLLLVVLLRQYMLKIKKGKQFSRHLSRFSSKKFNLHNYLQQMIDSSTPKRQKSNHN